MENKLFFNTYFESSDVVSIFPEYQLYVWPGIVLLLNERTYA